MEVKTYEEIFKQNKNFYESAEPTIDAYQEWVDEVASPNADIIYCALKICGESGEVAEVIGKSRRAGEAELTDDDRNKLTLELGDVVWYLARIANLLDLTLDEIMLHNVDKLEARQKNGTLFSKDKRNEH